MYISSLVTFSALCIAATTAQCPPGTYYDTTTEKCDKCSLICDFSTKQSTERDCNTLCPEYNAQPPQTVSKSPDCPSGEYYDPVLPGCDSCSSICYRHEVQGTSLECKTKCPDEYHAPSSGVGPTSQGVLTPGAVAGVVVAAVAVTVAAVLGLVWLCCPRLLPGCFTRCQGYKTPIQESRRESDSSLLDVFVLHHEASGYQDSPDLAFADLHDSRHCSLPTGAL